MVNNYYYYEAQYTISIIWTKNNICVNNLLFTTKQDLSQQFSLNNLVFNRYYLSETIELKVTIFL